MYARGTNGRHTHTIEMTVSVTTRYCTRLGTASNRRSSACNEAIVTEEDYRELIDAALLWNREAVSRSSHCVREDAR